VQDQDQDHHTNVPSTAMTSDAETINVRRLRRSLGDLGALGLRIRRSMKHACQIRPWWTSRQSR